MNTRTILPSLVLLSALSIPHLAAGDWPHWRGPDHDGIAKETDWSPKALSDGPKILWRASLGTGFASFSVAKGRVYTTGNTADTDTLFCFEAESGRELWKISYAEPLGPKYYDGGTSATPTVDGDTVFHLSRQGLVFALDAATGKEKWRKDVARETGAAMPEWGFAGSPFVHGDLLILNMGKHGTAVNKKTGQVVWTTGRDAAGYGTPTPFDLNGRKGVAVFAAKELAALEPLTGRFMWSVPWKTQYDVNAADPIFSGTKVFLSSGYGTGGGVTDLAGGRAKKVWANQHMHNQFNSAVLIDGHLYGISGQDGRSGDAGLVCVEFATGQLKWKERSLMFGAMSAATGKLIAIGEKGELVIAEANPNQFVAVSRAQVLGGKCWTVPVLANGLIYVRNSRGDMVCVDLRE